MLLMEQIEGIGALRSHKTGPEFEDDCGISSDEGKEGEGEGEGDEDEDEEELTHSNGYTSPHPPRLSHNQSPSDLPQYSPRPSHAPLHLQPHSSQHLNPHRPPLRYPNPAHRV